MDVAGRGFRPTVLNRLSAAVRREVPAAPLEAFRRAGAAAYELDLLVDARRRDLQLAGVHPWDADAGTTSLFLATWNARVLQTMGAELLEADRRLDPATAGFVPAVTHRQVWAYFQPVETWLSCAHRAAANTDFWIGDVAELPAALPPLLPLTGAPAKHLKGLLIAADAVDRLVEQTLAALHAAGDPPPRWTSESSRVQELAAQARSSLHYAQALWHPDADGDLTGVIVRHLQPALVLEHHLGQFLALPELVSSYRTARTPRRRSTTTGTGTVSGSGPTTNGRFPPGA